MSEIFTVTMPDIGEGVIEGEVIEWLKQINDPIKQDEPIVVLMTDKATVELPAPYPGKLIKQYYRQGEIALKDKPLYDIELSSDIVVNENKSSAQQPEQSISHLKKEEPQIKKGFASSSTQILAIPADRKLAEDLGVDLRMIHGTGRDGRITSEDIKNFVHQSHPSKTEVLTQPEDQEVSLRGIQQLMAKKMSESKQKIPHFSYFEQVEATRLIQLKENFKSKGAQEGIHVTYMPFLIRALSLTLKQHPEVNSSYDPEQQKLFIHSFHHIGIAMSTQLGLIVPVLKNVERMTLREIVERYEELKSQAHNGKLKSSDMKEGTITISNFGILGNGMWATPIINYPEAAILAVSRIHKQPLVKNEALSIREVLNLSWSFDHRIIDGDKAAAFSHDFAGFIQNPAPLLI